MLNIRTIVTELGTGYEAVNAYLDGSIVDCVVKLLQAAEENLQGRTASSGTACRASAG